MKTLNARRDLPRLRREAAKAGCLTCPFCGALPIIERCDGTLAPNDADRWMVICVHDHAGKHSGIYAAAFGMTRDGAVLFWNRRIPAQELVVLVDDHAIRVTCDQAADLVRRFMATQLAPAVPVADTKLVIEHGTASLRRGGSFRLKAMLEQHRRSPGKAMDHEEEGEA